MPAKRALGRICRTALSIFAVGARLAGEPGAGVYLLHRVIVFRGQASLLQANRAPGCICCTALSFFAVGARLAGEPGAGVYLLHRVIVFRGQAWLLQANRAPGCICRTALLFFACRSQACRRTGRSGVSVAPLSFFAGKPRSYRLIKKKPLEPDRFPAARWYGEEGQAVTAWFGADRGAGLFMCWR